MADVGCGRGELLDLAGGNFAQAMGCDPSASMLSSSASNRKLVQSSLTELPFADCSIDFVTAVCVYHHVHGISRTMLTDEIGRVLGPGGLFCIIEHNPWNPVTRAVVNRCPVDADAQLLTVKEGITLLEASGFRTLRTDYLLFLPECLFEKFAVLERALCKMPLGGQYALLAQAPA
jgi:SAM-dependent methyltransferase